MSKLICILMWTMLLVLIIRGGESMYTSKLIHRYSEEMREYSGEKFVPEMKSREYYGRLLSGDLRRQEIKLGSPRQLLFPAQGSRTFSTGNELGWLHYTWIDIGTPKVSFLVALDDGSDLLWVPCDCVQCAPLSADNYSTLDKNLNEYSPGGSSTSKPLTCSHQLCDLGPKCESPSQPCLYNVQYNTENTSSSGQLVEDVLYLASSNSSSNTAVKASVIFGCGERQSGGYLDGVAPDGLMGLGLGEISIPSLLAKAGLIHNSFSLCFNENGSGRIFFGDQGFSTHHWTPFLPLHGKYSTYVVGVNAFCIGKSLCLKQTSFHALVDSGTSFTFIPEEVYTKVVHEFDREVTTARVTFDGYPWDYCYESSVQEPDFPSVKLLFSNNDSLLVQNPIFLVTGDQGILGYCLAIQPTGGDIAIIGQNFMTGYRMVFDREGLQLGWSHSDCQDLGNGSRTPMTPSEGGKPSSQLPTDEQQSSPGGHAVPPAIAGRAPSKSSAASAFHGSVWLLLLRLLCLLASYHLLWCTVQ